MIRKRNRRNNCREGAKLDTSSLIDVSFLLLIYFLITSTLEPREGDLGLTMPDRGVYEGPSPIDFPTIEVTSLGVILLEDEVLDSDPESRELVLLADRMKTYREASEILSSGGKPRVHLKVDDEVSGQRFIDVMNCLAGVGISNISLDEFVEQ